MDKIVVTPDDIDKINELYEGEKGLSPKILRIPIDDVEILYGDMSARVYHKDGKFTIYVEVERKKKGKIILKKETDGSFVFTKNTLNIGNAIDNKDFADQIIALYLSIMVYMVDGGFEEVDVTESNGNITNESHKLLKGNVKTRIAPRKTYITRKRYRKKPNGGHHASHQGEFSVRGHYRHYKSGEVVWIEPFVKGTGVKKDKTYKL